MDESCEQKQIVEIAVLKEQIVNLKDSITLQAREYERRLQELNHAHQIQMDRNAQYVSREAWELRNLAIDSWRREVDKARWIAVGMGIVGGGLAGALLRMVFK